MTEAITQFTYWTQDFRVYYGTNYTYYPTVKGGGDIKFKISSGTLPEGINLRSSDGRLNGTPKGPRGTYTVIVTAYNDVSSKNYTCDFQVGQRVKIEETNMINYATNSTSMILQVDKDYDFYYIISGDVTNYQWDKAINLPKGMQSSKTTIVSDEVDPNNPYLNFTSYRLSLQGAPNTENPTGYYFRALINGINSWGIYSKLITYNLQPITFFTYPQSKIIYYKGIKFNMNCNNDGNFITFTSNNLPAGLSVNSNGSIVGKPIGIGQYDSVITASNDATVLTYSISFNIVDKIYNTRYVFNTDEILIKPIYNIIDGNYTIAESEEGLTINNNNGEITWRTNNETFRKIITVTYTYENTSISQSVEILNKLSCFSLNNRYIYMHS